MVSHLDLARFCFRLGLPGWGFYTRWGFYNMLVLVLPVAFAALAILYPRRWVFIAGSIFAIYQLLFAFVGPHNPEIQPRLICLVLTNAARVAALAGLWVKPAACHPLAVPAADSATVQ